jgi:hypothetical protein
MAARDRTDSARRVVEFCLPQMVARAWALLGNGSPLEGIVEPNGTVRAGTRAGAWFRILKKRSAGGTVGLGALYGTVFPSRRGWSLVK